MKKFREFIGIVAGAVGLLLVLVPWLIIFALLTLLFGE